MMSGRKEADVGLRDVSTPVYVTADPGVIALTGQADVTIVVVGSGAQRRKGSAAAKVRNLASYCSQLCSGRSVVAEQIWHW